MRSPLAARKLFTSHFAPLLLVMCMCLVLTGCGSHSGEDEQAAARNTLAKDVKEGRRREVKRAHGTQIKWSGADGKGRPLWKISAKTAEYAGGDLDAASKNASLQGAEVELYRDGNVESSFKAEKIDMVRNGKNLLFALSGDVRARTSGPWTGKRGPVSMQAPRADIDVNARRVWARQGATMSQGIGNSKVEVSAHEVQADIAMHSALLANTVRASAGGSSLTADTATWNWASGRVLAGGKVVARHAGTTISGRHLDADTSARRGELRDGVRTVAPQGEATAEVVHFDWARDKVLASGGVTLKKDGGTLSAARIEADSSLNGALALGGVTLQKDGTTLRAAQAQAFEKMTRASASGDVTLIRGDITVRADHVQAVNLHDRSKAHITADGSVRVTQPGVVVTAGHAEASGLADKTASRIVASNDVRFTRNGKIVSAARVEATNLGSKDSAQLIATGGVRFNGPDMAIVAGRVETANFSDQLPAHFVASGGVVARGQQATVRAGRVQRDNGRVVATGSVTLLKNGNTLSGSRLESDDDFKTATLTGNVNARTADGGVIKAGSLQWQNAEGAQNPEHGQIQARDGVTMTQNSLRLRGDRLDATADGARAVLTGNVVVVTADGATVRAPSARYDKKTDKIYASGGVSFTDPKQGVLRGKTLVYVISSKKAVLTDVRGIPTMDLFKGKNFLKK